ncbi:hypothetical protein Peur_022689 [Populus x canadensis]
MKGKGQPSPSNASSTTLHALLMLRLELKVVGAESDSTVPVLNRPQVSGNQLSSWNYICQFSLNVPFSFPAFVNPIGKKISKREKILLNVNSGVGKDHGCGCSW